MKILLISPLPPPAGGIATWTETYQKYAAAHGISLSVVNIALQGKRAQQINVPRQISSEICRTFRVLLNLCHKIRNTRPNLIHLNSSCSRFGIFRDYLCVLMARLAHIPIVLHCHCNIQDQLTSRVGKRVFQRMVNLAAKTLVLNSQSLEYVNQICPNCAEVVPNFIETENFHQKFVVNPRIQNVLFVGHVQPEKGVPELLEAAKEFPDIHFSLVGPVKENIMDLHIPANVELCGPKQHRAVCDMLHSSDLFLFPSHTEGFSMALAEAMASGLPVIATDVGANRDMLENNGGIIIPVCNVDAMIQAIKSLQQDMARRSTMSTWNTQKVASCYTVDTVMAKMAMLYHSTIIK